MYFSYRRKPRADTERAYIHHPLKEPTEEPAKEPDVEGYAKAASLISSEDERSGDIFLTFDEAATRNLLYMERGVAGLVEKQHQFDLEDTLDIELKAGAKSLEYFQNHLKTILGYEKKQAERHKVAEEIKIRIKEYHEALVLQSQVLNLPRPTQRTLGAWQITLKGIVSDDGGRLEPAMKYSLCSLKEQRDQEPISNLLLKYCPSLFSWKPTDRGVLDVSSKRIANTVSVLATVLAFGLLFGAIEVLDKHRDHAKRVGYLAGFIMAFAITVYLFTGARKSEIFAATAAYAAVLMVYVGQSNTGSGSSSNG